MTTTPAMPELPEPELGYIETDKSRQPAFSARQMRAAMQAQPAAAGVSDAEIVAALEAAGVKFQRFMGGITGTKDCWSTAGSQDVRKLLAGVRAILSLRPQAVTSEPGAYESRYAEWRQFYGNRITQWMSADELRLAVSRLMTVDAGSPELLLIHAMHLIDQAAPEWIAGEPANLQAAARDADEWLALIQRLNDAGRWRFSQPDSRTKLDGCRVALSKILCAHAPKAVPMTEAMPQDMGQATIMGDCIYAGIFEDEVSEVKSAVVIKFESGDKLRDFLRWHHGITAPAGGEKQA